MNRQQDVLLDVRDLRIAYQGREGRTEGVAGISFQLQAGEILAIVGESGSGKSTTAAALVGLLAANARIEAGSIRLAGQELTQASERQWQSIRGRRVGFVPQDPGLSLDPVKRIGSQLIEALTLHGVPKALARERSLDLLREVGLADAERVVRGYPHQLSGGMRQRVLIAIALANDPPLIIADEPTSALDVGVQRQILDRLQALARERGTAVLLITHDLGVALDRADRLLVMHQGRIVEAGDARRIFQAPQHAYTRQLLSAAPSLTVQQRRAPTAVQQADALLVVRDLSRDFSTWRNPGPAAVDGVSFHLPRRGTTSLVGESGSGKSTTARLILGLERPDAGSVVFDGQEISKVSQREWLALRRRIQVVYQNPYASLNPRLSLEQIICEPLQAFAVGDGGWRRQQAAILLEQVELPARLLGSRPSELSGGQRQRVAIARALALEPELLVLDEPLSALDASVQGQILKLLGELQARLGLSYLFISHDLAVVRQISDQVVVMQAGRVVEQGACEQIFQSPCSDYTRSLLADIPGRRHSLEASGQPFELAAAQA
ncbi:ABC transporter ATP-binding protein [Pseudomonas sp. RIT-PI-q]|uniref:dipeptide ABC transporter ATP-binding protein n=1 Tax=Pseudomonas sp. RIT-PI-q TaxID=1690247 RepID=UPI0006CE0384|nr:ABC transporter ATP-binding protein [Pseudomonas sp. RIT-PI-q]KPG98254.1 ABC transporter ATP-binding protein [Pseudomonas sp. RIT-PI-q]